MFQTHKHDTALGPVFSTWTEKGLYSVALGDDESRVPVASDLHRDSDANVIDHAIVKVFEDTLVAYSKDGQASFDDVVVDPTGWTPFFGKVYECCRQIPPGETMTYKQLAATAGSENASRAVGTAMSKNRILLVIPCHRVLASNGQLRGFSAPGGLVTKQSLLDLENVERCEPLLSDC